MTFTIPGAVNTFLRPATTLQRCPWTRVGNFTTVHSSRFLMTSAERSNLRQISPQFDRFSALAGKLCARINGPRGWGGGGVVLLGKTRVCAIVDTACNFYLDLL
ncbi:hypothetical protein CEXT_327381 [Caerostris extrusa]|uniref:Uncharacterized protein n=1 Tax=Caerostris extrusa TaxID=172846 RepID=A0AAV4MPV3_CAEEX|nr:hypothetical protein CEXT_327381 [Caerostris extrusa]